MSMIKNDGLCVTQFSPYDDPQHQRHYPIKPTQKVDFAKGDPFEAIPMVPVSLIEFTGRDGVRYHVNPCRVCGALITYAEGTQKDEE